MSNTNTIVLPIISTEQKILNQISEVQSKLALYLIKGNNYLIEVNEDKLVQLRNELKTHKKNKNETTNTH
jgi:hypothetical protein